MKNVFSLAFLGMLLSPVAAMAHETQQFQIGDETYTIVIGSRNEPTAVDDKAGVELTVTQGTVVHDDTNAAPGHQDPTIGPVSGLEKTLKVEVSAGDQKKTFDLSPTWGKPGSYEAVFIPTVQTTYTYRLLGTINGVTVDLPFMCNPAGHPQTAEDTARVEVSQNVTRILKRGAFGCPTAKEALGFPEPAPSLRSLSGSSGGTGTALGIVALVFSIIALGRTRKGS